MPNMLKTIFVFTAVLAAITASDPAGAGSSTLEPPAVVQIKAGSFQYWAAGEFTRDGKPVDAPHRTVDMRTSVSIMTHQVTVGEYNRCVAERVCLALAQEQTDAAIPAVMVSWNDARAYATWLSKKLGEIYRLPTDEEWSYAAGSRAPAETPLATTDTVARWMARYDREAQGQPAEAKPQPVGHFGANENGLFDVAGNVWEWTDTCYARTALDTENKVTGRRTVNCGVRVAEGRHRAYVVDFIRDPRAGGCAAGIPPSNLGFRLVRDSGQTWSLF